MTKTDSVAVLRERQINELVKLADDVWHQRIEQEDIRGLVALILDLKPDAALSVQGESKPIAWTCAEDIELLQRDDYIKVAADGPRKAYPLPLYLHPAPPGSDAVTEEMPPLPIAQWGYGLGNQCHYYTEDQMLAYGRLCKAAMVSKHWGYVVGGTSFYYPDFPRSEWPNHASVVAVFSDGVNLAALAARTGKGEANV